MLAMMQSLVIRQANEQEDAPDEPQVQPAANATMEGSLQLKILQILQEMQATQNAGHDNADRHNEGGGNLNVTRDIIGTGFETRTVKRQIKPHSNEQTNRSTAGRTAHAITNRARATGRRRDIRIIRRWQTGLGGSNAFCGQLNAANAE